MKNLGAALTAVLAGTLGLQGMRLSAQTERQEVPTFQLNSNLVFLDVTVLDKQGNPVKGLTKEDFTITDDKEPQKIFSFEGPDEHRVGAGADIESPDGKAPTTIIVLDLLNSSFEDFAFIRYSVRKFLNEQPAQLTAPAEMMVLRDDSFELLQGYTRNKADLVDALAHLPAAMPFKFYRPMFTWDRFAESVNALEQVALQNKGIPGKKNVVWVGRGGPGINTMFLPAPNVSHLEEYIHTAANMLVDGRMSLYVIYPGLKAGGGAMHTYADLNIGNDDPFAHEVNFGIFVNDTGGKLFYNRNDVDVAMAQSVTLGSEYYTLTYQPHDVPPDGKFRRVRVSVRDPHLRVVTKAGYFAPEKNQTVDPRMLTIMSMANAVQATIPLTALDVKVGHIERHPDTNTAELTVILQSKNLDWMPAEKGSTATFMLAAATLSDTKKVLSYKIERVALGSPVADPASKPNEPVEAKVTLRIPKYTDVVRVVAETETGGRIGAASLSKKLLAAAPASPTPPSPAPPQPALSGRPGVHGQ